MCYIPLPQNNKNSLTNQKTSKDSRTSPGSFQVFLNSPTSPGFPENGHLVIAFSGSSDSPFLHFNQVSCQVWKWKHRLAKLPEFTRSEYWFKLNKSSTFSTQIETRGENICPILYLRQLQIF